MRFICTLILTSCLTVGALCQSTDQNYVLVRSYSSTGGSSYLDQIRYYDGLGRPSQVVNKGISPTSKDVVSYTEYDDMGREIKQWLPIAVTGSGGFVDISEFQAGSSLYNGDSRPFNETVYDSSPLSRITHVKGAGNDWSVNNKSRKLDYEVNDGLVACFYVNEQMQLAKERSFLLNSLYKTVSTDEDGKTSTEFKDRSGRVVMTRNSQNVDTYYVYNDLGQLMYVLPPIVADNINGSISVGIIADNHTQLKMFGYLYKYDQRGNCIYKRLPGCEPIYMIYDKADRLVLSQDGNQRESQQWSFIEYDILGRVVQSGITTNVTSDEDDLIEQEDGKNSRRDSILNALIESTSSILIVDIFDGTGYNSMSLGLNPIVLIENYYDNYQFINMSAYSSYSSRLSYSYVSGFDIQYVNQTSPAISAKGMLTGTMVRMLDNSAIEVTAMYYDDRGRVVQSRANNRLSGYDYDLYHYSFTGQILNHRHVHKTSRITAELIENYRFTYDHTDRLISTFHKLNTRAEVKLSELVYDELGRVSQKTLHSGGETIDYTYNIRNWTKSITSNRFSQTLYYQDALDGKPVYYNGNISAIKWGAGATQDKKYHFSYDGLNRMTNAIYSPDHLFDECITSYDKHGNILALDRAGWVQEYIDEEPIQGIIDDLQMVYQGNQLINAHDNIEDWEEQINNDFYDVSDENYPTEYLYDANGNQYADLNKGIAWIKYNLLNLPEKILFQNGNKIEYLYDASGVKRQAKSSYSTTTQNIPLGNTVEVNYSLQNITTTQYYGNYVYEKGVLKRILTPEGYIETFGSTTSLGYLGLWRYTYFLKDYQGNIRHQLYGDYLTNNTQVLHSSTSVDYYPFGMQISNPDGSLTSGSNPYLYNGKEIDRMHGLNQYDYGARWRDGALPPWTTVDPLAEKYYSISPYAYCANNPVLFVDPDGRKAVDANGNIMYSLDEGWTKYATPDAIRIGNAMMQTDTGKKQWFSIVDAAHPITLEISSKSIVIENSNGAKTYKLGDTDNAVERNMTTGEITVVSSKITIYEGSINSLVNDKPKTELSKSYQINTENNDQRIASVAGHEAVHATNQTNIQQSIENKRKGTKHDIESYPRRIELNILNATGVKNHTLPKVK